MKKNAPQRRHHRSDLLRLAKQAMTDHGLQPEFSASVEEQVAGLHEAAHESGPDIRDLRDLLWCSLDNDDSRDLDQLTVCELLPDGTRKMRVAIADVDALVKKGSAIDHHAQVILLRNIHRRREQDLPHPHPLRSRLLRHHRLREHARRVTRYGHWPIRWWPWQLRSGCRVRAPRCAPC